MKSPKITGKLNHHWSLYWCWRTTRHYFSVKCLSWMRALKPVSFLSTMLYTGNVQQLNRGDTDVGLAAFEKKILGDLLSKIPHQVSFKTYPSMRYPDIDPILECASSLPNISVYTKLIDFRYLIEQTRILVTSRTSSTLGWCMASGKPVILIDFPGCPFLIIFTINSQIACLCLTGRARVKLLGQSNFYLVQFRKLRSCGQKKHQLATS